jgi:hypothetical protein
MQCSIRRSVRHNSRAGNSEANTKKNKKQKTNGLTHTKINLLLSAILSARMLQLPTSLERILLATVIEGSNAIESTRRDYKVKTMSIKKKAI